MKKTFLIVVLVSSIGVLRADNWPQWRGPAFNGSSNEKNLPDTFSPTENIKWALDLPGPGAATPIVWEDKVFISSAGLENQDLYALCISVPDGKILWQEKGGVATASVSRNDMASPSPVTDGKTVFFLYGSGDLAAFDYQGKKIWDRNLARDHGPFNLKFGYSSSPLLFEKKLYVVMMRRNKLYSNFASQTGPLDSFLLALDPQTGKDLWRHVRKSDAHDESLDAYTSPILFQSKKQTEIIIVGGDYLTGHNPQTGSETWRLCYNQNHRNLQRLVPSAVPGDGLVYAVMPRGGQPVYAVKADAQGEITWDQLAWLFKGYTPDACTPLLYRQRLYVLDGNKKALTCLDPHSGREIWQGKLGGNSVFRASPTGADGKIYCLSEAGEAVVLAAGDEFEIISRVNLGGKPARASIAAAGQKLFIRTAQKLYCLGK